jgi:6-phosphogluconolactonase
MGAGLSHDLRIYPDLEALSRAAAAAFVDVAEAVVATGTACNVGLSGGRTPRTLYRLLAEERERILWRSVHVFWGDERCVPRDDPRSNFRMVREALLDHVPIPRGHVHPIPVEMPDAEHAAQAYEAVLRAHFGEGYPRFDLLLLGMGADGHTASLFPGSPALREAVRSVAAVAPPAAPSVRVTLTLPALSNATRVWFLVAGTEKASALARVLAGQATLETHPAAGVRPTHGSLTWWVDEAASSR